MLALFLASSLTAAQAAPPTPAAPPAPRFVSEKRVLIQGDSSDVFAAGEAVVVEDPVGDNAFLAGETVTVDAAVRGDLFATGQTLYIDAPVGGDVYAAAGQILLGPDGSIGGHLLAAASEVRLEGPVSGGVSAGAGLVVIRAPIGGDVTLEAGEVLLEAGSVGGALTANAGRVALGAPVGGDVAVEAGDLELLDGASIGGDLTYSTPAAAPSAEAAVRGEVSWSEGGAPEAGGEQEEGPLAAAIGWTLWTGWDYLAHALVGGALLLLSGGAAGRASRLLSERPSQSLGAGVVGFVILPIASLIACALIIPLPLGLLGLLGFGALLYTAQLVAAQALGDEILRRLRPGAWGSPIISLLVGLAPIVVLSGLPWVGNLVWFAATALGGGALWLWLREPART